MMRKYRISVLIGLISITLIALIFLQIYWIKSAIELKEEQFGLLVNKALTDVVSDLTEEETAYQIIKEMSSQLPDTCSNNNLTNNFDSIRLSFSKSQSVHDHTVKNKSDSVILNIDKAGNVLPRANQVITRANLRESYVSKVKDKTIFVEKIVDKLISYNQKIEERLDTAVLKKLIEKDLRNQGIWLDFEYAVLNHNDSAVFQSFAYQKSNKNYTFLRQLYPDDLLNEPYQLQVYFPRQMKYLFHSLGFMAFSSITLTAIIVIIFSLTIIVIIRQKKVSEIKNDFVSNVTHELKTPISTISLAAQMLSDKSIAPEFKNIDSLSEMISNESKRLAYMVEKVLQLAANDRIKVNLKLVEVNVNELIDKLSSSFRLQLEKHSGKLKLYLNAERPLLMADEVHLSNVLNNLFDNAIKYCNQNPEIEISTRSFRKGIIISIHDNGIGIPKEHINRIFEQFFRVPTGNVHNVKGFGLGLSYVKKIITEHKGKITVDSVLGEGTRFKIILPFGLKKNV